MFLRTSSVKTFIASLALGLPLVAFASPKYSVDQLVPGRWRSINDYGLIGGSINSHDALLDKGSVTYLGIANPLWEESGDVSAISNSGTALVNVSRYRNTSSAFLAYNGEVRDIGYLTETGNRYTRINGLNEKLQAVGASSGYDSYPQGEYPRYFPRPVLYQNGSLHDLGTFGGNEGEATAINNAGKVIGWARDENYLVHHFLYENGSMRKLDLGFQSLAFLDKINDADQIIGSYYQDKVLKAFLYTNGTTTTIEFNNQLESAAKDINNLGQVIGSTVLKGIGTRAFLYTSNANYLLDQLTDPAEGWTITEAHDINNKGQILATGCKAGICSDLLLNPLSPVPEPSTYLLMLSGLAMAGIAVRRRTEKSHT